MILKRFYEESLAHASYLVGCPGSGEAIIVDPNREVDVYLAAAKEEGLTISAIAETHIHADYVSGARQLSAVTGARMYLSSEGGPDWQYAFPDMSKAVLVGEGASFHIGAVRFDVTHTPGHTPEHISFLITDEAAGGEPLALFTGDFVFVGDVGRPDLLENAAGVIGTMEPGARELYRSLSRFKQLPEYVMVWPAHGAGSACGKSLGGVPVTSVGYEAHTNWALKPMSEDEFVTEVLAGHPDPPPYFARMKFVNKVGPDLLYGSRLQELGAVNAGDLLVDVRTAAEYRNSHPIGALHLPLGRTFLRWAGWLVSTNDRVVIVAEDAETAQTAASKLSLIGVDLVIGWIKPSNLPNKQSKTATASDVMEDPTLQVIDVRTDAEWNSGHLARATHVALHRLPAAASGFKGKRVAVHCRSGARALIAASVLERAGVEDVASVVSPF